MIGKMILQGLAAAALIAGAAGVYAANAGTTPQSGTVEQGVVQPAAPAVDNGYLTPQRGWFGERRDHHDDDKHRRTQRHEVRGDKDGDTGYRDWKGKRHDD